MKPEPKQGAALWKLAVGRLISALALFFCVPVGLLFVSVAAGGMGIVLGVAGYALGPEARPTGRCALHCRHVPRLLAGQGAMPGFYDEGLDGVKEALQGPFGGGDVPP